MSQDEIDELMKSGEVEEEKTPEDELLEDLAPTAEEKPAEKNQDYATLDPKLELLYDLSLPVSIELGRTNMLIRDILKLGRGSVIEFDKLVSEPVDILVNGKKVAAGEVVVVDKHFGIRITTLVDPSERIKGIKK
ncbi:MAG: flagellar motor switch protein FliN [Candidatus Kapaibacterium sp.]